MEYKEIMDALGISDKESKVLYCCMQLEGISASNISKRTGIERTNVYKILESLVSRGLITTYKSENINMYRSLEPEKILELLKNNIRAFEKNLDILKKNYIEQTKTAKVDLFSGRLAVKRVINSIIIKNMPYCAFGGVEQAYRLNYFENISSGLIAQEKNVKGRVILSPKERTIILSNEEYRISPRPLPKNVCTVINDEMIAILNWGEYCNAVIITDKNIAEDYLTIFENLWIEAKKVSKKELKLLELKEKEIIF